MKQQIAAYTVYSTKEAAEILQINAETVLKLIREQKLQATSTGNKYLISGQALLKFMNMNPQLYSQQTPERQELVWHLGEAIGALYPLLKKDEKMGVMLHQSINLYADENTLRSILADVQRLAEKRKKR